MTRFVLVPHTQGFGHRVRCDAIGRGLLAFPDVASVHVLVRRDDPLPARSWTTLPTTRSRLGRTFRIVTAKVLVLDGTALQDRRVRLMRRLGGKLVLILQPMGFASDPVVSKTLRAADLIIVPYPPELFQLEGLLQEVREKVHVVAPVTPVPNVVRTPGRDVLVYCEVSRPVGDFNRVLAEACTLLSKRLARPVEYAGGLGELREVEEHVANISRASVVVTQGITAAFEARSLGIPVVLVPRPDSPEQRLSAQQIVDASWAEMVSPDRLSAPTLATALESALRGETSATTHRPSPQGLSESVGHLRSVAGLPDSRMRQPGLSIIATNFNCAHALRRHLDSIYGQWGTEEFEYILTDNYSDDGSPGILSSWAASHPNFRWRAVRCTVGKGRELASREASAPFLLTVDTDTVYGPMLRPFVERAIVTHPTHAVQAIYAGVVPHYLWRISGGRGDFNTGEDFEMWMRLWRMGRMRWYPVRMGENLKEPWARDATDHFSTRYNRWQRMTRLVRSQFDLLRLAKYDEMDLPSIWSENSVDFELAPLETTWFGEARHGTMSRRVRTFLRSAWSILHS